MATDWTSNAHKAFVTAERGMVAIELVSDCSPVQRMHLHLTPLEARSLATWINEMADEAGGVPLREKYLHESVYAEARALRAEVTSLRDALADARECSFCGAPCAEPLDRVCQTCATERGPRPSDPRVEATGNPSQAAGS